MTKLLHPLETLTHWVVRKDKNLIQSINLALRRELRPKKLYQFLKQNLIKETCVLCSPGEVTKKESFH